MALFHKRVRSSVLLLLYAIALLAAISTMPSSCEIAALAASAAPSKKMAVLGATGKLGQETVREFLAKDIPVRCLVRPSSVDKLPQDLRTSPLVEVVAGELLSERSFDSEHKGGVVYRDDLAAPSDALVSCLEGCGGVVACYGATRTTKFTDVFFSPEDIDPTHSKQINYRSMMALVQAAKTTKTIRHIVRITGKGEDPTGIFSVLLNGLGSFAKLWNYQGEVVLRTALKDSDDIGYTIVRPGIMKQNDEDDDKKKKDDDDDAPVVDNKYWFSKDDLVLEDEGGNDLKVTPVTYSQIAGLLVDLLVSGAVKDHNNKVTLAAMNPSEGSSPSSPGATLWDKIAALRNDRREFPKSLVAEHKAAVKAFFTKVALAVSATGMALVALVAKLFF